VENWIGSHVDSRKIIDIDARSSLKRVPSSRNKNPNQRISAVVWARPRYSASVLERETVDYFLAVHVRRLRPKNIQAPVVDLRSSTEPAQSTSEKLRKVKSSDW